MTSRSQKDDWGYGSGTGNSNRGVGRGSGRDAGPSRSPPGPSRSEPCNDLNCPSDPKLIAAELAHQKKELSKSRSQQGGTASSAAGQRLNPNKCPKPGESRPSPSSRDPCRTDSDGKLVCDRGTETDDGNSSGPTCRCGVDFTVPEVQTSDDGFNGGPYGDKYYNDIVKKGNTNQKSTPEKRYPPAFFPKRKKHASGHLFADEYPATRAGLDEGSWDVTPIAPVGSSDLDQSESPAHFQISQTDESVILTVAPTHPGEKSVQVVISKQPNQNMTGGSGSWARTSSPFETDISGIYPMPGEAPRMNATSSTPRDFSGVGSPASRSGQQLDQTPPWLFAGVAPENASMLYEEYRDASFRNQVRGQDSAGGGRQGQSWQRNSSDASNLFPRNESQRSGPKSPQSGAPRRTPPGLRSGRQNVSTHSAWPYSDTTQGSPGNRNANPPWSYTHHEAPPSPRRPPAGNTSPQNMSQYEPQGPWPYPPTPLDELSRLFPSDDDLTSENEDSRKGKNTSKRGG